MVVTVAWCSCCGGVRLLAGGAVRGWFLRWLLARSSSPLCCSRLLCDSSLTVRCGSSRVCGGLDLLRCGFGLFRLIPRRRFRLVALLNPGEMSPVASRSGLVNRDGFSGHL
ncbi:predicted protein [Arabidopsis lyrata subsp. lyrata]|uniref:Predicted protein n=1 Tax=Arabidopsis lyrata subsp. lyrata TaxID=81972 RepID=D7ME66_ARALL|nr:predicted protein [Arabidopsis lyrata subsp. lyrata]